MKEKIKFSFYVLTHPFDGFWDLKHEKKGSVGLALIFVLLLVLSNVITQEVTSFLFNETRLQLVDIGKEFQKVMVAFILFCVGNWSITTLMEGEGRFRDIVMVFGYAALPMVMIKIPLAFLSLSFTFSESVYYSVLTSLAGIWFFFLLFTGIMTIHQYTVAKMVATTVLTILAMLALVFVYLLFFKLISQFVTFALAIYQELNYRM